MENALLIGLSRQMALSHQMDVVANNMANIGTAGYKSEALKFEEYLMPVAEVSDPDGSSGEISYVLDTELIRNFDTGPLRSTGNPFDVALNGEGWFVLETENGERYSRNGHFTLDNEGTLVNASGQPVLSLDGTIVLSPDETDFTVAPDGTVTTSAGEKGRLRIVNFENESSFSKEGQNLFDASEQPTEALDFRVAQGFVEESNVVAVTETANMIEVMRAYVSTSKMLEQLADLKKQAIDELGQLQG
jgi:flagellar basal-body rod protein FlgF